MLIEKQKRKQVLLRLGNKFKKQPLKLKSLVSVQVTTRLFVVVASLFISNILNKAV